MYYIHSNSSVSIMFFYATHVTGKWFFDWEVANSRVKYIDLLTHCVTLLNQINVQVNKHYIT